MFFLGIVTGIVATYIFWYILTIMFLIGGFLGILSTRISGSELT